MVVLEVVVVVVVAISLIVIGGTTAAAKTSTTMNNPSRTLGSIPVDLQMLIVYHTPNLFIDILCSTNLFLGISYRSSTEALISC